MNRRDFMASTVAVAAVAALPAVASAMPAKPEYLSVTVSDVQNRAFTLMDERLEIFAEQRNFSLSIPVKERPTSTVWQGHAMTDYIRQARENNQKLQLVIRKWERTPSDILDCTSKHRVAVLVKEDEYIWKQAQDLQIGDRLAEPPANMTMAFFAHKVIVEQENGTFVCIKDI